MSNNQDVFMFRDLELNKKMQETVVNRSEEKNLFRFIRRELVNHTLSGAPKFKAILRELENRCNAINSQRIGRGPYLHVDGAMPTDHTIGWIKITYLDVCRAQADLRLAYNYGEIGLGQDEEGGE